MTKDMLPRFFRDRFSQAGRVARPGACRRLIRNRWSRKQYRRKNRHTGPGGKSALKITASLRELSSESRHLEKGRGSVDRERGTGKKEHILAGTGRASGEKGRGSVDRERGTGKKGHIQAGTGRGFGEKGRGLTNTGRAYQRTGRAFQRIGRAFQRIGRAFQRTGRAFQGKEQVLIEIFYHLLETIHGYYCLTSPRPPTRSPASIGLSAGPSHKGKGIRIMHYPLLFA